MTTVSFHTLGCRLNQAETALAADDLAEHGYSIIPWGQNADVLVINTCAVTGAASQKSRQVLRAARRHFPNAFIVLMGCDSKVDADKWSQPGGPDLIVPHPANIPLSTLLAQNLRHRTAPVFAPAGLPEDDFTIQGAAKFAERTRANLKIQDGCNFYCTYCIVPYSRGRARSRDLADVLREAMELIDAGYKELVLCGVNLTTYNSCNADLADLLTLLASLRGDFRIRLGSAEPAPVISKVISVMEKEKRICRFLHLPLQYGENSILKRMGRHYSAEEYAEIALDAAARIPGLCLGADLITGFPGETEETFRKCMDFTESLPFGLLHVFPYSPRPGTDAAGFKEQVPPPLAAERAAILGNLGEQKAAQFAQSQTGLSLQILAEEENPVSGWTDNYLHVTMPPEYKAARNTFLNGTAAGWNGKREISGR